MPPPPTNPSIMIDNIYFNLYVCLARANPDIEAVSKMLADTSLLPDGLIEVSHGHGHGHVELD